MKSTLQAYRNAISIPKPISLPAAFPPKVIFLFLFLCSSCFEMTSSPSCSGPCKIHPGVLHMCMPPPRPEQGNALTIRAGTAGSLDALYLQS